MSYNEERRCGESVVVVIPVYRAELTDEEHTSLQRTCDVLGVKRRLVVVHPEGLNLTELALRYPDLQFESFSPDYFRGIRGYNRLMTSTEFYERFAVYEYLLVAQTDAYLFRDDLDCWVARGYDYVGAPWLKRPAYRVPPLSWIRERKDRKRVVRGQFAKGALYGKVGNGGLSLRKIKSHIREIESHTAELEELNRQGRNGSPEDVFWAFRDTFVYPDAKEALTFSIDQYPRYCYWVNRRRLPMGCHGWFSKKTRGFWRRHIR